MRSSRVATMDCPLLSYTEAKLFNPRRIGWPPRLGPLVPRHYRSSAAAQRVFASVYDNSGQSIVATLEDLIFAKRSAVCRMKVHNTEAKTRCAAAKICSDVGLRGRAEVANQSGAG
jgi:hypothetical protein